MEDQRVSFPEEEPEFPGVHIDIKHDLGTGGDPTFSGSFHGAGSGGAELVDEHKTGLASAPSMGLDKAAGVRRGPGHAGAHPAMVSGGGYGLGAGEGGGADGSGEGAAGGERAAQEAQAGKQEQATGPVQAAAIMLGAAVQGAKEAVGLEGTS